MTQTQPFQAEIKQLLNILVHSLYKDRDIFLRELVSNASDALNRLQFEMLTNDNIYDPEAELYIHITVDEDNKQLHITDTGIGMTADEMIDALGVIARSGAKAFLEAAGADASTDIIGQFGVGFYSVFMVAEKVEVISRSYHPDAEAARWVSTGDEGYQLLPADRDTRGTEIIVHLREDAHEYADEWRIRQIIKHHSDFVQFPIYVGQPEEDESWEPVNQQMALWRKRSVEVEQEEYDRFYQSLTLDMEPPALTLHSKGDAPLQYYALLFIPAREERNMFSLRKEPGLKLYARKVLIQEYTTDLLPEYLPFVQGVVDSEDLPLSVSRETIQSNAIVAKLKSVLTGRVLSELQKVADSDPERYQQIWDTWGAYLKHGVTIDFASRERLLPLLRFASSEVEGLTTLHDYVGRMAEGQDAIYYVVANSVEGAAASVHLEPFRARGIEVLYMTDTVDGFMIPALGKYDEVEFVAVDSADLDLEGVGEEVGQDEQPESLPADDLQPLIDYINQQLGEAVESVRISKVLSGSPARLVAPKGSLDRHQQKLYQLLEQEFEVPTRIMEINPAHPIIRNLLTRLERNTSDGLLSYGVRVLYQNALLADGLHPNPADMAGDIQRLLEEATTVNGHSTEEA